MRVLIVGDRKNDFPYFKLDDPVFIEELKKSVKKRLDLRSHDEVIIWIIGDSK